MCRQAVSNERGAILIESVLSLTVIIPILSGMILVGQLYQERALMSQALRSSTRPAAFFRSIGVTSENIEGEEQPTELTVLYESICGLLDLSFSAARLNPSDYELTLQLQSLKALMNNLIENPEVSSRFLVVRAKRRTAMQIPFFGAMGKDFVMQALFPISLDESHVSESEHAVAFQELQSHTCDPEGSLPS